MDNSNTGTGVSDDLDDIVLDDDEDASSEYCDLPPPRKKRQSGGNDCDELLHYLVSVAQMRHKTKAKEAVRLFKDGKG